MDYNHGQILILTFKEKEDMCHYQWAKQSSESQTKTISNFILVQKTNEEVILDLWNQ